MSDTIETALPVVAGALVLTLVVLVIACEVRDARQARRQLAADKDARDARARATDERRDADRGHVIAIAKSTGHVEEEVLTTAWVSVLNGVHDDLREALIDLKRECQGEAWAATTEGRRDDARRSLENAGICTELVEALDDARDGQAPAASALHTVTT